MHKNENKYQTNQDSFQILFFFKRRKERMMTFRKRKKNIFDILIHNSIIWNDCLGPMGYHLIPIAPKHGTLGPSLGPKGPNQRPMVPHLWTPLAQNYYWANSMKPWDPTKNLLYLTLWPRGLQIGPFRRFSGRCLEQCTPKKQNSSQSSRKKFNIRELKASIWQKRKKKTKFAHVSQEIEFLL